MKHAYATGCSCARCARERTRRGVQSNAAPIDFGKVRRGIAAERRRQRGSRSPAPGSAEWAETRGDDLGASPDY